MPHHLSDEDSAIVHSSVDLNGLTPEGARAVKGIMHRLAATRVLQDVAPGECAGSTRLVQRSMRRALAKERGVIFFSTHI